MEDKQPLLSICIPTYSRADVLVHSIDSIVKSPIFKKCVEIIVSDNCSTDDTDELVRSYVERFPDNIKLVRTPSHITAEENFVYVMEHASGQLLKWSNDYSVYSDGSIEFLVEVILKYSKKKPLLFFKNTKYRNKVGFGCSNLDTFIDRVSSSMTWIGSYGFWKSDFESIEDKLRKKETLFIQIDWIFRLLASQKECYIFEYHLTTRYPFRSTQGGYNFFKVQIENYLSMQWFYVQNGLEKQITYIKDKKKQSKIAAYWVVHLLILKEKQYSYDVDGAWHIVWKYYKAVPVFYVSLLKELVKIPIRRAIRLFKVH